MGNEPNNPNFSNVQGGSGSTAPAPAKADYSNVQAGVTSTAPVVADPTKIEQTYTVVAGDSLSKIAKHFYGNANKWPLIQEANQIKNPDLIHPGQVLKIPVQS